MRICPEYENSHFHIYFLNMDIPLNIVLIGLKICVYIP